MFRDHHPILSKTREINMSKGIPFIMLKWTYWFQFFFHIILENFTFLYVNILKLWYITFIFFLKIQNKSTWPGNVTSYQNIGQHMSNLSCTCFVKPSAGIQKTLNCWQQVELWEGISVWKGPMWGNWTIRL